MCFSIVVCFFVGSGGRKTYFVAGEKIFCGASSFLAPFCICDPLQNSLYLYDKPRGAAPRRWPASSPLCCFFVERERERELRVDDPSQAVDKNVYRITS